MSARPRVVSTLREPREGFKLSPEPPTHAAGGDEHLCAGGAALRGQLSALCSWGTGTERRGRNARASDPLGQRREGRERPEAVAAPPPRLPMLLSALGRPRLSITRMLILQGTAGKLGRMLILHTTV